MNKNTGKRGRIPLFFIKLLNFCYISQLLRRIICYFPKNTYLCNVFFIVLDLRLTKVGARRCSFFFCKKMKPSSPARLSGTRFQPHKARGTMQTRKGHIFFQKHKNLLPLQKQQMMHYFFQIHHRLHLSGIFISTITV